MNRAAIRRRALAAAGFGAALGLVGCATRTVEREIVEIDGRTFLCSFTENRVSGNQSDPQCVEVRP